jgi:folate-binding protein YgfZ
MRFVVDASARARLLVSGPDGPGFLHRMSTQHVGQLASGEARLNVLTTDKGRIVDVVHHVVLDDGVLVVGNARTTDELVAWLDRYFFSEKLGLAPVGGGAVLVDAVTADAWVAGARGLAPWEARSSGSRVAVRTFDRAGRDGSVVPTVVLLDRRAAPDLPAPTLGSDEFLAATIAAGVPTAEIDDAFTPLDLALHDAIHWAKGCYIGQEVIARLDTYGKQKKQLLGLVGDLAGVGIGDEVVFADEVIGAVTSVSPSPWCPGLPSALALVRRVPPGGDVAVVVRRREGGPPGHARLVVRRAAQLPPATP